MKTMNILKLLVGAMLMPAMLFTTSCGNEDEVVNNENNVKKGYAIPVTINVTRQGDKAGTRATYNEMDKVLEFSTGDKLFVKGTDGTAGAFAGTLEWQSGGTFSGTIYTAISYSGTADALLTSATSATATLLPSGYESLGYLTVSGDGCGATLATDATKAFATSKAAAVEQLSFEQATTYSDGFALAPQNAILNFTVVTGQWGNAPASSSVSLQAGETTISGSVAPVEGDYSRALANFAIAVAGSATPSSLTLTVDGTSVSLGSHTLTAGKIYNQKCANINATSPMIGENEKWLVYGTGEPSGWRLTIAEGATVTLHNVNLNNSAIIAYRGNNTIILADGTTNTIDPGNDIAIDGTMAGDKTLTIKGTGTLIATGGYYTPAIGVKNPEYESCGAITIESTVHLTATAGTGQSKAITTGTGGGTVTIGGVVYADGADSPFVYPVPAPAPVATDLSTISVAYTASDGETLTGTLANNVKISIADGATVTLNNVNINGTNDSNYKWAGITCLGDATIILTGENTVKGFYQTYPGICVPENKTVTIQGIGSLTASSSDISGVGGAGIGGGYQLACGNITIMGGSITAMGSSGAAGIGSGNNGSCGNITITGGNITATGGTNGAGIGSGNNGSLCGDITITGGDITATGGSNAAGIGSGNSASCGNITITGGTINATGTNQAAGIGSGYAANNKTASCGTITITNGVTSVTATKGNNTVPNSIGVGKSGNNNATNTCGTVTIGCTLDTNGNPVGGTTGAITESPYTYQP